MKNTAKNNIIIFDTTLRDGEQSPGATMTMSEKIEIAKALDRMGVDVIEAGFAAASPGDLKCIEEISKVVTNATVCSLARAIKTDIDAAYQAVKFAKKPRIHTFISTSDIHLKHQFKMNYEEVLQVIHDTVKYARQFCNDIEWSAMDATRSNIDFLCRAIETAIKAGATTINIPDTVGYTIPDEFADLIKSIQEKVPMTDNIILSVHCHNDLGMAVANSLAAVKSGARQVECTINGIGERAGNAALEEVVMAIKTRKDKFPFQTNIDAKQIAGISKLVSKITNFPIQKNKAIVGVNAFAHESGIHQDGMLKARETYEIITPESVGFKRYELVMGKHSGRAALRSKLALLNIEVNDEAFQNGFKAFKKLADSKKHIVDEDIISIFNSTTKTTAKCENQKTAEYKNSTMHPRIVWMDGKFIPWEEANVPLLTHSLHYSGAVFEGERAYNGNIFKLTEHNKRLHQSAKTLGYEIPYSVAELDAISQELMIRNNLQDAYVRPIAWRGDESHSLSSRACKVHVAIAAWAWKSYFAADDLFSKGLKLMWSDWVRPAPHSAPVTAKTAGLYSICTLSKNKAEQAGFHDALMLDYRGYVAECTCANFFMVKNGVIYTPIADCFLDGITRQTVISLAKSLHIPIVERHIHPYEVDHADEIFITGSAVEISPVSQIANHHYAIGAITKKIAEAYTRLVREINSAGAKANNLINIKTCADKSGVQKQTIAGEK